MKTIIANLKMYLEKVDTVAWVTNLRALMPHPTQEVIVCPSLLFVDETAKVLAGTGIAVAGQDCASEPEGALTGEISVSALKSEGAKAVVLGHSERRRLFGETNQGVNKKLSLAADEGLYAIVCIENDPLDKVKLMAELHEIFKGVRINKSGFLIAYEPSWAIGSGKNLQPKEASKGIARIKAVAKELLGFEPRVVYGGSVSVQNAGEYLAEKDIDGLFIGTAAKNVRDFVDICSRRIDTLQ